MKISNLAITDYYQFKDVNFNFTYPTGHPKAGLPLEKICLIGQSGSGKTTLLNLLKKIASEDFRIFFGSLVIDIMHNSKNNKVSIIFKNGELIQYEEYPPNSQHQLLKITQGYNIYTVINNLKINSKPVLINLPSNFMAKEDGDGSIKNVKNEALYDFGSINVTSIWHKILDDIKKYKTEEIRVREEIRKMSEIDDLPAKEKKKLLNPLYEQLEKLEEVDNNPLKVLANEYLDIILGYFKLKVNTTVSATEDIDKIGFIKIEDNHGKVIPNGLLSSGTKQFILSSLPFYLLKPTNTIILFDEPEISLYPNIQKLLVSHYSKFTTDCQFFYATHSPIIASCFDPWEVFELKFNDEGYVYVEQYYEGDRHVDNYKIHPKYLTYDLILRDVFDVKDTDGEDRARQLTELIMLEEKLKQFKRDGDNASDSFKTTMDEYQRIGKLLSWPVIF